MEQKNNLIDIFESRVGMFPDKILYNFLLTEDEKASVSYVDFYNNVLSIAALLQDKIKITKTTTALILYHPGMDYLYAFYSCLFAGIIAVPAYPPDYKNANRVISIIRDSNPSVILASPKVGEQVSGILRDNGLVPSNYNIISISYLCTESSVSYTYPSFNRNTIAFLQYTSGSTSDPKGAVVTHDNLIVNSFCIKQALQCTHNTEVVSWLPPYHDMGLIGTIIYPFFMGMTSTLMSPLFFIKKPVRWLRAITNITTSEQIFSPAPNFSYQLCCDKIVDDELKSLDLRNFKLAGCGSEPIKTSTYEKFYQKFKCVNFKRQYFIPCYGLAEATLLLSGGIAPKLPSVCNLDSGANSKNKILVSGSTSAPSSSIPLMGCGSIVEGHTVIIVNPETSIKCSKDEIGEIWACGGSIIKTYWKSTLEADKTFNSYTSDGEGPFFRTGDLGFFRDGELYISGRIKDCIIINGTNHYPQDIESTIIEVDSILRNNCTAVFAIEEVTYPHQNQVIAVQEVSRNNQFSNYVDICSNIKKAVYLSHNLVLNKVVLIEQASIPKTSSGKIQRTKTKQLFLEEKLNVVASH